MYKILEHSRILVTGGAGFIGSNLVETLLAQGNEVVVLDNFSTGKRENLAPFAANRLFTLIEGDIRDLAACRKAAAGAEYVLHEAALGSVPRSIENPAATTEVNVSGFVNVLFAAHEAGAKRVVYASSSSVYGDDATLPKVEEKTGRPLSPYAVSKYADELFADNFSRVYGIEAIGLRYFNVYGRRQDPAGAYAAVIPKFAASLIRHESPVINGDGSNSRDFTYIDDVVQANQLALLAECPEAVNTVCNIARGERTTNAEYARNEGFRDRVVYGMLTAGFYSRLVGVQLPGKYCLFQEIQNSFVLPVFVGDTLTVSGKIVEKIDPFRRLKIKAEIHNQEGKKVSRATLYVGVLK